MGEGKLPTICIDCRYCNGRPSGIGELVHALIEHVPVLAPDLQFLLLRHPAHVGRLSDAPNVHETVVPYAPNGPLSQFWLPKLADLSAADVFHAPSNILPVGLPIPAVTTVHDMMWVTHPQWCSNRWSGHVERVFYRSGIAHALRNSFAIAAISMATREAIIHHAERAIPDIAPDIAGRISITGPGVSGEFAPALRDDAALSRIGIAKHRRFVLTVGQYKPYKNHEGAIRMFAAAFGSMGDIDLVLVQRQGPGARRLAALARRLGIADRLHIMPALDRTTLIQLYSAAAALLHPSLCEGFGNPVAEAMACGCPVITSDRSAMPEVADGAARLIDPMDVAAGAAALRAVVGNSAAAKNMAKGMAEAGIKRAKELRWSDFAAANIAIYRRVLGLSP